MHTQKSFGVFVVSLISIIIIGLAVNGCGTVKRETGGGGGSGGNSPATTITAADCVWTTMDVTGLSWGSNIYLDTISGNPALTYDYQQDAYVKTNRVLTVWNGTGWSAQVSGDTTTRPVWPESNCTSNGSLYKATIDNSMSYQPKIFITKDGITVATFNESVFGDSYNSISLQVFNNTLYISYSMWNMYNNSRNGLYVEKINTSGTTEPINYFIECNGTGECALKIVSDTEAYLAYMPSWRSGICMEKWSPKK